ncbi:alpha/beta fold hydrolase [Millisia brevis]|uniref:alpha/beta fold hydrolase n=1 Tax=Millisia brevis TaxID=264148 RepID=UPI00082AE88C|nr:alpha/beta fold hydrolase [Millisia brevis]
MERDVFEWRGRRIAWWRAGSGPPVVFCHGTPWSSHLWLDIAQALASEYTVLLWDMPGYGASSMDPDHDVDLGVQGEAFAALLTHWSRDHGVEPHVVAHDFGGAVALRAHLLHSRAYRSLTLVDVVALRPWGSTFFTLVREQSEVFGRLPDAMHEALLRTYISGAAHRPLRADDLDRLCAPWLTPAGKAAFYRQIAQADERFTAEIEPLLPKVAPPVHIVWGADDTWIPADRARRLADAIPGATLSIVPGAGHLIQWDQPARLAVEIHRVLRDHPTS